MATIAALIGVSGGLVAFTVLARRFRDVPDGRLLAGAATAMTAGAVVTAAVPVVAVVAAGALLTSIGLSLAWLGLQHRMLTLRPGEVGTTKAVITAIEMAGFLVPIGVGAVADHTDLVAAMGVYAVLGVAVTALARTAGGTSRRVPAPPAVPARRD